MPMRLEELVEAIPSAELTGDSGTEITGLAYDSRKADPGDLFFCVTGMEIDGHEFAPAAVERGAAALVCERGTGLGVSEVLVPEARAAMAPAAAAFYGRPTAELKVAGVTGTNGKTTTAFLLRDVLESAGVETGLMGTVKQIVGGVDEPVERTTPEAVDLQATFRRMCDAGDTACVMEASSHALVLKRCDSIEFDVAIFTNLTQDHLDFHSDMEDYFAAKRLLFESGPGTSVVNVDDAYGRRLAADFDAVTYSAGGAPADYTATGIRFDAGGAAFTVESAHGRFEVSTGLPGLFNVSNALAALAAAVEMGVSPADAVEGLAHAGRVPGRFEPIDEGQAFAVLVDYAHTPDSVENVLKAARDLTSGRLIVVVGAGGDRDRAKRPLMGRAASVLADVTIVTSDNPRSEEPEAIIADVLEGIDGGDGVFTEVDRSEAIRQAVSMAAPGDTVVVAGKGHEQGQEFKDGHKVPFDDRDVARRHLRAMPRSSV